MERQSRSSARIAGAVVRSRRLARASQLLTRLYFATIGLGAVGLAAFVAVSDEAGAIGSPVTACLWLTFWLAVALLPLLIAAAICDAVSKRQPSNSAQE